MNRAVIKRKYYAIELILESPISVFSGYDIHTDMDVLRNGSGEVFIPGTSIAGAFRNYLNLAKDQPGMMGYSNDTIASMSSVLISDFYFDGKTKVSVRDGIRLDDNKMIDTDGKFELEMIENGAGGLLYLSCIVRESESIEEYDRTVRRILLAVNRGEIRFGAKKSRGFGRFCVKKVYEAEFDASRAEQWISFMKNWKNPNFYETKSHFSKWINKDGTVQSDKYICLSVPLRLNGGISIRKYSARPGQADFEHLTCHGEAVVPGSSWNGLIRSDAKRILRELGCQNPEVILERWFGYVKEKQAKQSDIIVEESILKGARELPLTRTQIDRFTASAKNGALYSEISRVGGTTFLTIRVNKKNREYLAILGLLLLVVEDIQSGYAAVGGMTAVGRGIFSPAEHYTFSENIDEEECNKALAQLIKEETQK